jgi:hypothetical protein
MGVDDRESAAGAEFGKAHRPSIPQPDNAIYGAQHLADDSSPMQLFGGKPKIGNERVECLFAVLGRPAKHR